MSRRWAWAAGAHRISRLPEDVWIVAAVWGPSVKEEQTEFSVRGVRVDPTQQTYVDGQGRAYRWCIFPDYRRMLVNEGNIRERRVSKYDAKTVTGT